MLEPGQVIDGRFQIVRVIGEGGMGVVAEATHLMLKQQVAIKVMRPEIASVPTIVDRFLREAQAVAALRTDHVCRVFDVGQYNGVPYIIMELLTGTDLASTIAKKPLPITFAVDYTIQACVALAEAHARGIVHRDLKPANLFVTRRADGAPHVKVLDFGIAKAADELRLTGTGSMLGSPGYMSPEQLMSPRDVDARTDIWSLGVTLYQLISRRLPFPSAQLAEFTVAITTQEPAPLHEDPALRAVIFRCLEKSPAMRFADVASLATALAPFGGPPARAYLSMIVPTLAGQQLPPPTMPVSQQSSTVASLAAPGPMTPPPMTPPPMTPAPMGQPMPPAPTFAPAATKSRAPLYVVLAILLVGGGVLGGYLVRGGGSSSSSANGSASGSANGSATAAGSSGSAGAVVATAPSDASSTPVTSIDAAVAVATNDPWGTDATDVTTPKPHSRHDAGVARAAPDAATVATSEQITSGYTYDYTADPKLKKQLEDSLVQIDNGLKSPYLDDATRETLYMSGTMVSCMLKKPEKAHDYYSKMTKDDHKAQVMQTCNMSKIDPRK